MWIMMNDAMFSIVQDTEVSSNLLVRARIRNNIEDVFDVQAVETTDSDYRFRAYMDRDYVMKIISDRIDEIDYPNFKNSVTEPVLKKAYNQVWSVMYNVQEDLYGASNWGWGGDNWVNYDKLYGTENSYKYTKK